LIITGILDPGNEGFVILKKKSTIYKFTWHNIPEDLNLQDLVYRYFSTFYITKNKTTHHLFININP